MAKEEKKVKHNTVVDVIGTGNNKFLEKGKKFKVHTYVADKLIASGDVAKASTKGKSEDK